MEEKYDFNTDRWISYHKHTRLFERLVTYLKNSNIWYYLSFDDFHNEFTLYSEIETGEIVKKLKKISSKILLIEKK